MNYYTKWDFFLFFLVTEVESLQNIVDLMDGSEWNVLFLINNSVEIIFWLQLDFHLWQLDWMLYLTGTSMPCKWQSFGSHLCLKFPATEQERQIVWNGNLHVLGHDGHTV